MEKKILDLIEDEVAHRVQLKLATALSAVSQLYEIPLERLIKDTSGLETRFCRGILKTGKRCLKNPKDNGYCKFHKKQTPDLPVVEDEGPAPWD